MNQNPQKSEASAPTSYSHRNQHLQDYVRHGYALFPLSGKKPTVDRWQLTPYDPNLGPLDIVDNYGVVLHEDDLVIDYDPRNDTLPGGVLSHFYNATGFNLLHSGSFLVQTGGGGYHVYLKKDPEVKIRKSLADFPGLDFLSKGSFVVGAGCQHPDTGRFYEVPSGSLGARLVVPKNVLDTITRKEHKLIAGLSDGLTGDAPQNRFIAYLRTGPVSVQGAHGDLQAFKVAAFGKDMGLTEELVAELMIKHWNSRCLPPWSENEIRTKVQNAFAYSENRQGSLSPQAMFRDLVLPKYEEEFDLDKVVWNFVPNKVDVLGNAILKDKDITNIINFFSIPAQRFSDLYQLIRFNTFTQKIEFTRPAPWHNTEFPRSEWHDKDNALLRHYLNRNFAEYVASEKNVEDAVIQLCELHSYHPLKNYLRSLTWDGKPRLDKFLVDIGGAEDTKYTRAVTRCFFIAAVARVMQPGCQFDHVLVLEGGQGIGKTSLLRILGGEFYGDVLIDPHNKDTFTSIQGKWIIELSEMEVMRRAEMAALKAFITRLTDDYRPPYGKVNVKQPRQCVMAGTVNPDGAGYLNDITGNRRFWPVELRRVDLAQAQRVRDQVWAEAVHRYNQGERWYIHDEELIKEAATQQARRQLEDPWEDALETFLQQMGNTQALPEVIKKDYVLTVGLNIQRANVSAKEFGRVKYAMSKLGYAYGVHHSKQEGKAVRGFKNVGKNNIATVDLL